MVISVSKRKSRTSKKTEDPPRSNLCSSFFKSIFYLTLLTILFFFLFFLWLSFTSVISENVLHICVFSRKLNDPYCLTADSKPGFQIPNNLGKDKEIGTKILPSEDNKEHDVFEQEDKPKNLDSALGTKDGEMGFPKNVTFAVETAEYGVVSDDPTKILPSEDVLDQKQEPKKLEFVLDQERKPKNLESIFGNQDVETGSRKNIIFADETPGNRVSDYPTKNLRSEFKEYDVVEQEDKPKNHDQERKPENKVDLISLIDLKAEEEYNKYIKPKSEGEGYALRAVIKCLYLQRSWLCPGYNHKLQSCEGKGVYVYDLPSKFNKDLLVECNDILPRVDLCSYFKNEGFGEAIENLGQGWFNTHMYSLEPILHSRVLKHPCRVYNETQAKLFYVPYYGGFDVLRWHYRNVSDDVKDRLGIEVLKWLEPKESWRRNAGKDHVFVLGKITWDFRRNQIPWGSRFLELQEMQNPTKLLIERQPWQVNDIAIPHPTYFHPKTDKDITSWQIKIMSKPRKSLVSFAGGARPGNPNSIRSTLIEQCISLSSDQCRFLNCSDGSCKNPKNVIDLFQDSDFCLQPPGDSATRRSVFDSLISGCIPVIFTPYTAYYQYAWHLPEDHQKYSVFISEEDVKEKRINVVEKLMAKTLREREDMRSYIVHQLLPGLVYGDSNARFVRFRDAFDITFDSLLEKINKSE